MSQELKDIESSLYLAKSAAKKLMIVHTKLPMDNRPTVDDADGADIVSFCRSIIDTIETAFEDVDQINEREDSIATRRRIS